MLNKKQLIFDLGFHNGDDTDFYLQKGFNVVAIEANPNLVKEGNIRFAKEIQKNRLTLINKVVSDNKRRQDFYIHPNKSDWSSAYKEIAESDGSKSKIVSIDTISFSDLCHDFGIPFYAKIDIEGCDLVVAQQLSELKNKPKYVSFELSKKNYAGIFSWLYLAGYKKFQLINQMNNVNRKKDPTQKIVEGKNINYHFTKYSSGFFGNDLPKEKWLSYDEAINRYLKYRELKIIDNQELALGWLDIHASL